MKTQLFLLELTVIGLCFVSKCIDFKLLHKPFTSFVSVEVIISWECAHISLSFRSDIFLLPNR